MINTNIRKMIFLILILTAVITAGVSYAASIGTFQNVINGQGWVSTYRINKVTTRKEYTLQLNNPEEKRNKLVAVHRMYNYYHEPVSKENRTYEGTKTRHLMEQGEPWQGFYLKFKRENWWDWYAKITGRFSPDRF